MTATPIYDELLEEFDTDLDNEPRTRRAPEDLPRIEPWRIDVTTVEWFIVTVLVAVFTWAVVTAVTR